MDFHKGSWQARWFFWSLGIWGEFRECDAAWQYDRGTNLCHFVRVVFLCAPLVLALHLAFVAFALATFIAWPLYLFGGVGYAKTLIVIAAIIFVPLVAKRVRRRMRVAAALKRTQVREASSMPSAIEQRREVPSGPGIFEILWQWVMALKKEVCPQINFVGQEEARDA